MYTYSILRSWRGQRKTGRRDKMAWELAGPEMTSFCHFAAMWLGKFHNLSFLSLAKWS